MTRAGPLILTAFLIGAVLWPLAADDVRRDDSFPLSTYPMFSQPRAREVTIVHLVAIGPDAAERVLGPPWIGERHVTAAARRFRRAVRKKRAGALCEEATARLRAAPGAVLPEGLLPGTVLEVRADRFDAVAYFGGRRSPLRSKVHARCSVEETP